MPRGLCADAQTGSVSRPTLQGINLKDPLPMKTDNQLQQDVLAELRWEPSVNAAQIGTEVTNGIVTLAGHVASYSEK